MNIPKHIAIIMDGNGRWAQERGLPRREGHKAGVHALRRVLKRAGELGVSYLTVYTFSTENWKRPSTEVKFLMKLFRQSALKYAKELLNNNVKVKIIGRRKGLDKEVIKTIEKLENATANNTGIQLNIAFNYGGRAEILDMFKKIQSKFKTSEELENIKEEDLKKFLYEPACPEVDLMIRTGGDHRISNFLLWQSAYAELFFVSKYWPEFTAEDLDNIINKFKNTERRFGGLKEKVGGNIDAK